MHEMNEVIWDENDDDDSWRSYTRLRAALPCGGVAIVERRPFSNKWATGNQSYRYAWRIEGLPIESPVFGRPFVAAQDALQSCCGTNWCILDWQVWLENQADGDPEKRDEHYLAIKTLDNWRQYP